MRQANFGSTTHRDQRVGLGALYAGGQQFELAGIAHTVQGEHVLGEIDSNGQNALDLPEFTRMEIDFLNRRVALHELKQSLTYEGLLEGLPTAEGNQRRIKFILEDEQDIRYGVKPYLVPPTETPLDCRGDEPYPFGVPSSLPSVLCIARFESFAPANNKAGDGSGLKVIWFQSEFALPIAHEVLRHLGQTDWNLHAGSFEY